MASDVDGGQTLSFAIASESAALPFDVTATGRLIATGTLDYEVQSSYAVYVEVSDNDASPLTTKAKVTVRTRGAGCCLLVVHAVGFVLGGAFTYPSKPVPTRLTSSM